MKFELSKNLRLLVLCSQVSPIPPHQEEIKNMAQCDINWEELLSLAGVHRQYFLLHKNLQRFAPGCVPEKYCSVLGAEIKRQTYRSLLFTKEMIRLIALLEKNGVPTLSLKGPILGETYYRNICARHLSDIDLLIPMDKLDTVRNLILGAGYQMHQNIPEKGRKLFQAIKNQEVFYHRNGCIIEIHWRLSNNKEFLVMDFHQLYESSVNKPLQGNSVRVFPIQTLLLYLCIHGSKHLWKRLKWLCDIHEIFLKETELDWREVWELAGQSGNKRSVAYAFGIMEILWNVSPPIPEILKFIRKDYKVRLLVKGTLRVYQKQIGESKELPFSFALFIHFMPFLLKDSFIYRIEHLFDLLIPSLQDMQDNKKYSSFRLPLYFIRRVMRVIKKNFGSLLNKK